MRALLRVGVAVLCLGSVTARAAAEKTKIAVLDVSAEGVEKRLARVVNDVVLLELSRDGAFEVIGSADIEAMLGMERQKQLLGCSDASSSCLAELSGALGARYLVTGSLTRVGSKLRLDMRLLDTSTAKAVKREAGSVASEDGLEGEARRIALALLDAAHKTEAANRATAQSGSGTTGTTNATSGHDTGTATDATSTGATATDASVATSGGSGRRIWPWGVAGAGVIVAGVGGYLAYDASRFDPTGVPFSTAVKQRDDAMRNSTIGYSLVGVGVAAAVTGAVLALTGSSSQEDTTPTAALAVTGDGGVFASVGGRF